jgi:hypothetical protein
MRGAQGVEDDTTVTHRVFSSSVVRDGDAPRPHIWQARYWALIWWRVRCEPTAPLVPWYKLLDMGRPVKITTPIPTLEEFGERIGLSKAKQKSLAPIFVERRSQGDYAIRRPGSDRASAVFPTQREAVERARNINPNGKVLVERVRHTSPGRPDQWRKA